MSKQEQQTMQDIILASRKMLKPGDAHYKGYEQYAGKNPTPNPRIDRNNVRLIYQLVNKITYSPTAYTQEQTYKFNAIVAKNGQVGQNEIPGLLHYVNYVIIRQPNTNRLYALPYRVDQLLQNDKNDITVELYKNEECDTKAIITVGNAEAMIDSMTDSPAWIAINNCDPFGSEDELEKLQLTKPLMQYIKTKKQRYIAATCGFNGQELVSDGYTVLHSNKWDYCLNIDPFNYVKGDAIGTTKPITFETIRNLMPRYGVSDLLLELTYPNNQMPLLQKNRNEYTVMIGEMGIDLKSPERGDIQMPPHVSIVPPKMKAPYLEMPENFIQILSFIVNKSKKHVQDITFRIFKHNDPRCYYIQASGDGETPYQVTCIVETKLNKEEEAERLAEAKKAQAEKEARRKAQDEEEEAARNLGKEEREQVIREAQERIKAEEEEALQERLKAEQAEVARIRAEKAKQAPADNYNFTPTFTAPSILDEFDDTTAIVPVKPTTLPELPAVIEIDTPKARIDYLQDEQALSQLLATLSQIVGINVLLVGTWLWIDGDTKPVKEQLKQLGFRWHSQKKKWYMSLSGEYFKTRKKTHFIDIAMKYGIRELKTND